MTTVRKFGVGIASLALVAGVASPAFAADDLSGNRWAGDMRYDTAIEVSKNAFEDGASVVYIARGDNLVDAITAGSLKGGPVLLTDGSEAVNAKVMAEIKRLGASKAVVIGGKEAVSEETVKAAVPSNVTTSRIEGATRFETAAKIAEAAIKANGTPKNIYIANGQSLVDALVGGQLVGNPANSATDGVILLADGADKLPTETAKALNTIGTAPALTALGGVKAVSEDVMRQAAVAQTILVDSFVEDYQSKLKAAAEADLKLYGYVTAAGSLADVEKLVVANANTPAASETVAVRQAKLKAVFPKVPVNYLLADTNLGDLLGSGSGTNLESSSTLFYGATNADKVSAQDAWKVRYEAATWPNGDNAFAVTGSYENNSDYQASSLNMTGAAATIQDLDDTEALSMNLSGAVDTALKTYFPGYQVPALTTAETNADLVAFLQKIGWSVVKPAGAAYGTAEVAQNDSVISAQIAARKLQVAKLKSDYATAYAADLTAANSANKALSSQSNVNPAKGWARLAGDDRFGTSVAIVTKIYGEKATASKVYFANGYAFADAAVSGMIDNSTKRGPVVLVKKDSVPAVVANWVAAADKAAFIARDKAIAIGGPAVISDENLKAELDAIAPVTDTAKLSISFGPATVAYASGHTLVETSQNGTVTIKPTVEGAPSGSTQEYTVQIRVKGTTTWTKAGTDLALANSKKVSATVATSGDNQVITLTGDGATGASAAGEIAEVEVQLVGTVKASTGEVVGGPISSSPTVVKVSQKQ